MGYLINTKIMKLFRTDKQVRIELNVLKRDVVLYIGSTPTLITFGMTNETIDNFFTVFVDYDNIFYEKVVKDIKHIQNVFDLSDFIIITSSEDYTEENELYGNYHAICLDKCLYQEIIEILRHCRCDPGYLHNPRYYKRKHWVLRFDKKYYANNGQVHKDEPKFKEIIKHEPRVPRECSRGHYLALRRIFNIPKLNLNFDNSKECELIQYRTVGK